jgi:hypothetical protein
VVGSVSSSSVCMLRKCVVKAEGVWQGCHVHSWLCLTVCRSEHVAASTGAAHRLPAVVTLYDAWFVSNVSFCGFGHMEGILGPAGQTGCGFEVQPYISLGYCGVGCVAVCCC